MSTTRYPDVGNVGPATPCFPCRHYTKIRRTTRYAPGSLTSMSHACVLNLKRLDVPGVKDCPSFEREPGADDE